MRRKRPFEVERDLKRHLIGARQTASEVAAAMQEYVERLPAEYEKYGITRDDIDADLRAVLAGDRTPTGPYLGPKHYGPEDDGDFKNSAAKLGRAKRHFEDLTKAADAFCNSPPMMVGPFVTDEGVEYRFVNAEKRDGTEMSLIFGDMMHNLRSSLDVAVSEIVRLRGLDDRDAAFPFGTSAENLERNIGNLVRKGVLMEHGDPLAAEIMDIQPHWDGNFLLRSVAEFNNEDKHRNIVIGSQKVTSPSVDVGSNQRNHIAHQQATMTFNFPLGSCLEDFPLIETSAMIISEVETAIARLRGTVT